MRTRSSVAPSGPGRATKHGADVFNFIDEIMLGEIRTTLAEDGTSTSLHYDACDSPWANATDDNLEDYHAEAPTDTIVGQATYVDGAAELLAADSPSELTAKVKHTLGTVAKVLGRYGLVLNMDPGKNRRHAARLRPRDSY